MTFVLRTVWRDRKFAAVVILSMAAAIALTSTVYAVVDALLKPKIAIKEAVELRMITRGGSVSRGVPTSRSNDYLGQLRATSAGSAFLRLSGNYVSRGDDTRPVQVLQVDERFFEVLGVNAKVGRVFRAGDEGAAPRVVVVSDKLWRQQFAGEEWSSNAAITVNHEPRPVVGVVSVESDLPGLFTDIWELESAAAQLPISLVRLRAGVSDERLAEELSVIARQLDADAGVPAGDAWFRIRPLLQNPFKILGFHFALAAAALSVFIIVCGNIAAAQLARESRRAREWAVRSAVGANTRDIVTEVLARSALLSTAGLVLGLVTTLAVAGAIRATIPPAFGPLFVRPQVSARVIVFSVFAALVACILSGLIPALRIARISVIQHLRGAALPSILQASYVIVGLQIALALSVMIATALIYRTVDRVRNFDLGPNADRIVVARIGLIPTSGKSERVRDVLASLRQHMLANDDIVDAGMRTYFAPKRRIITIVVPGRKPEEIGVGNATIDRISPNVPNMLGLRILAGRGFQPGENGNVVLVDKPTADWLWAGESAVGRAIKLGPDQERGMPWVTVIGVVSPERTIAQSDVGETEVPHFRNIYLPLDQDTTTLVGPKSAEIIATTTGKSVTPRALTTIHRALLNQRQSIERVTVSRAYSSTQLQDRLERQSFVAIVFLVFTTLSLVGASIGLFAAMAQRTARRQRDFAVHLAMGATDASIRRLVMRESAPVILGGLAVGLAMSALTVDWLTNFVRSAVDRYDPLVYAGATALLCIVLMSIGFRIAYTAVPKDLRGALSD